MTDLGIWAENWWIYKQIKKKEKKKDFNQISCDNRLWGGQ